MKPGFAAVLALALSSGALALDTTKLKPTGYVNDFAGVLDPRAKATIEAYCASVERSTDAQFAVAIVDSLEGDPIEDDANKLFRQWGVGKKGKDEGLLLMLAIKDHKQRAEIGYGLEPIIPDGYAGGVLRGVRPILRQGNYGGAILAALQNFGAQVANAKGVTIEGVRRPQGVSRPAPSISPLLVFGGIFLLILIIRFISGGFGGGYGGGYGGGGMSGFLTGMLLGNMMGRRGGWGGGGWGGGGFGGGGGGGGGFGGFGGGDSGGGGASSDW